MKGTRNLRVVILVVLTVLMLTFMFPILSFLSPLPLEQAEAATIPPDLAKYRQSYKGFPGGQCTAFAAIRFDERAQSPGVDWHGDAGLWYAHAGATGWARTTNYKAPKVGAIVVWTGGDHGHVAIVEKTYSDGVLISEMNWPYGYHHVSNVRLSWAKLRSRGGYTFKGYIYNYKGTASTDLLQMTVPLTLTFTGNPPRVGDKMTGTFKVKNVSGKTLTIERLKVDVRSGVLVQDISGVSNITIAAGGTYSFKASTTLKYSGDFTGKAAAKVGGSWIAIKNRNKLTFRVYPGLPVPKCDFNGDNKADIGIFFDYTNTASRWHVWLSDGSKLNISNGYNGWWSIGSGYDVNKVKAAVHGDYNADGKTDVAALYDYGGGKSRWHVWLSSGSKFLYQGSSGWWAVDNYTASGVKDAVSGDFNADGKTDVAALYDYGGGKSRWHVWLSSGSKFLFQGSSGWWTADNYTASGVKDAVSGDFNADGKTDVAIFYNFGGGKSRWQVWLSSGSKFLYQGSSGWWAVDNYSASGVKDAVSGDFNGDGKADTAILYDYGSGKSRWHVWLSSGSKFLYQGSSGWWSVDSGYIGDKVVGATCGDFNKDTKTDVAAFYNYGSGKVRWHVWTSNGSSFAYSGSTGWWQGEGYTASRVKHIVP
jgi:surface antigen